MDSDFTGPVNIGSDEMISINDLARMVIGISKKELTVKNISISLSEWILDSVWIT